MVALICSHPECSTPLAHNPRRKGTMCQRHASQVAALSIERRQKCSAAMKARLADPDERARISARCKAGWRRALAEKPALRAQLAETGRRLGKLNKGNTLTPAGSPSRVRAARKQSEFYIGWCPLEYRDDYRNLVKNHRITADDARRIILDQIAADARTFARTGVLPQSQRQATGGSL